MITPLRIRSLLPVVGFLLAGCVAGGMQESATHLSPTECRDLTALRSDASPTMEQHHSELSALRKAGYDPSRFFDPYYPGDLQAAQRQVDLWFQADCQHARPG